MRPETEKLINKRKHILAIPIPTVDECSISLGQLFARFSEHDIGLHFNEQTLRYATKNKFSSNENLMNYLGNDVHPIRHGVELAHFIDTIFADLHTSNDGVALFPYHPIDDKDLSLLYFVAFFHDIGESEHPTLHENGFTPIGDKPTGTKTNEDRENEKAIRGFMYDTLFPDINGAFIDRVEAIIAHKPQRGDEFLHEVFELAHDLQMYATAEQANRVVTAHSDELPAVDRFALSGIASEVRTLLAPTVGRHGYWASRLLPADTELAA